MRCIIKEDVLSLGLPVTSQGLVYSVLIPGACEIAFVKEDDFDIMVQRGHAIDLPALQWEREVPGRGSNYIKAVEGRMIFRCDYQDDGHGPRQHATSSVVRMAPHFMRALHSLHQVRIVPCAYACVVILWR